MYGRDKGVVVNYKETPMFLCHSGEEPLPHTNLSLSSLPPQIFALGSTDIELNCLKLFPIIKALMLAATVFVFSL
ncbi:hypothetical protein L2E82_03556 [Cichorium intybus]|uniref:Uncharacterized protein n=1 Tax=Cichorium intybus TaxID=13427 RepID=A0ACB9H5A0_CICIN|nr:hypothetical protein L2E82_03556 [Cichorium intybus]